MASVGDLLGVSLAGLVAGAAVLLVFEAVMSLARLSTFGSANGWLAQILPAWLFV
jgi:predicted RecA/RadA family phage recombinase